MRIDENLETPVGRRDPVLSTNEVERYEREGFIVPKFRLSADSLSRLQSMISQINDDNPGLLAKPVVSPHVPAPGTRTDGKRWLDFAREPRILDLVEQLIGPDIVLFGTALFYKSPQKAPLTVWHRDIGSFPMRPWGGVIIWVAAYDSVIENGCLRVIPRSHAARELGRTVGADSPNNFSGSDELASDQFDETTAVDVEVEAGQMIVFDGFLIHGAHANLGTKQRAGLALRYMPATTHYDRDWATREPERFAPNAAVRPLFLVRGEDRCGKNEFLADIH